MFSVHVILIMINCHQATKLVSVLHGRNTECLYAKALQIKQEVRFLEKALGTWGKGESGNSALESHIAYT